MEKLIRYQLYQSETSGKYFVKYPESTEKEIGKGEYNYLLEEKNRVLDRYLNSKDYTLNCNTCQPKKQK
jgi:hypothetical protein